MASVTLHVVEVVGAIGDAKEMAPVVVGRIVFSVRIHGIHLIMSALVPNGQTLTMKQAQKLAILMDDARSPTMHAPPVTPVVEMHNGLSQVKRLILSHGTETHT